MRKKHQPATCRRSWPAVLSALLFCFAFHGANAADLVTGSELGPSELAAGGAYGLLAQVTQNGDRNEAAIRQQGSQHAAQLEQYGNRNGASAAQYGYANQFVLTQNGSGNEVELIQRGRGNQAIVSQGGDGNRATIEQLGSANLVQIQQGPISPDLAVQQQGNGLTARVIQY